MRTWRHFAFAVIVIFTCFLFSGCQSGSAGRANAESAQGGQASAYQYRDVTIPPGTSVVIRLGDSVSSAYSHSGDTFRASLARAIEVNGMEVVAEGSEVTGRVVSARPSGHLQTPAELSLTLESLTVGGNSYDLVTSDRSWWGRSHKKHDAGWIGGLAGAGALIGALAGHGKGALIGAGVGAGAGTATAYATGKKDIYLPSETELRFVLRQPLSVSPQG